MRAYQKILAFVCALVLLLCAVPVSSLAESAEDTADLAVSSADCQWELTATVLWQSACESQRQCAKIHPVANESVEAVRVTVLPQRFHYTIDTGTTKFNTAIEYDTDANRTAYSRVKHYIVGGKAYSYEYDAAGNISKITDPNGNTVEYEYDALNQLIKETYVAGDGVLDIPHTAVDYSYDTSGNILSKMYTLNGETVDTITYGYTDPAWKDRLTVYNGVGINFDKIGNPATWYDGSSMSWEHGRQLASYTDSDGVKTTYTYDDTGLRTSKTVGNVTTKYYVIDGTMRRMSDGTNTLRFVYGNGLSSVIYNGTEYWYVFNAQGDIVGLIDATGTYVVEYTYDSWGKILSKTGTLADTLGTLNPFRYRGYVYDEESGFYYCQTRYYDPEVGRWLNIDGVIAVSNNTSQNSNLFAYCVNNPVNCCDSTGYWFEWLGSLGNSLKSLGSSIKQTVTNAWNTIKNWGIVKHDVPAYSQGASPICWATCEVMVDSYEKGEELSEIDAYWKAKEMAISKVGEENLHLGGQPSNQGEALKSVNMISLVSNLKDGPLYAEYNNGNEAHMVVTGANIWKNEVYINNPNSCYGTKSTISFWKFVRGYPKDDGFVKLPLYQVYKID